MSRTKIPWSEMTWNPIIGCSKVSAGCLNCYAEKMANRLSRMELAKGNFDGAYLRVYGGGHPRNLAEHEFYGGKRRGGGWHGNTVFVETQLNKPLHWKKPRMIFVCSMGDLFHESVPFEWIDDVMAIIAACPHHVFQVLTKRPEKMLKYFTTEQDGLCAEDRVECMLMDGGYPKWTWPLPNLWLGVTAENQETSDKRIPILLDIPAAVRFVSVEPMLEGVDLSEYMGRQYGICDTVYPYSYLDWVIVGCESGPKRRTCRLEWVQSIVDQCKDANVPCFVKQIEVNGKVSHNPEEWPESLRVRQWPERK